MKKIREKVMEWLFGLNKDEVNVARVNGLEYSEVKREKMKSQKEGTR